MQNQFLITDVYLNEENDFNLEKTFIAHNFKGNKFSVLKRVHSEFLNTSSTLENSLDLVKKICEDFSTDSKDILEVAHFVTLEDALEYLHKNYSNIDFENIEDFIEDLY